MLFSWLEPIAPITPEISVKLPPPPDPLGPLAPVIGGLAVLLIVTVLLNRLLRGRRGAGTFFAFSVGLGNALMEVGAMLQPDRPKVTVSSEKDAPSAEEGGAAGGTPLPDHGQLQSVVALQHRRELHRDQPAPPHREPPRRQGATPQQVPDREA